MFRARYMILFESRTLAGSTNERDAKFFDIYEITSDGYKRTMLYRNDTGFDFGAISRDKRWIALVKPRTTNDSDIHLYDTRTKSLKNITAHSGNVNSSPAEFTPDGRALYFITDAGRDLVSLSLTLRVYAVRRSKASGER